MPDILDGAGLPDWGLIEQGNPRALSDALQNLYARLNTLESWRSSMFTVPRTVPYNSADFTALAPMTWTVDSADVQTFWVSRIGGQNVLLLNIAISNSTTGGTATADLQLRLPYGFTAIFRADSLMTINTTAGGTELGRAVLDPSVDPRIISLRRPLAANWPLETNTVTMRFHMAVPVLI